MTMQPRKILIACPTLGLNPNPMEWFLAYVSIQRQIQKLGFSQAIYTPYRQLWWNANNMIWNVAFENGFDYILRIDDDIHAVPDDAIEKLLLANKISIHVSSNGSHR